MIKENPSKWEYLKETILRRKRKKDLYYLQSLSLQHHRDFCYYLDLFQIRKKVYRSAIIYLKVVSFGKKIDLYFLLEPLNYSLIKIFQVKIFNYVNKALFITTSKNIFRYFVYYDSILLLHISINCAYFFCTFVRCSRIDHFDSNFLKIINQHFY